MTVRISYEFGSIEALAVSKCFASAKKSFTSVDTKTTVTDAGML